MKKKYTPEQKDRIILRRWITVGLIIYGFFCWTSIDNDGFIEGIKEDFFGTVYFIGMLIAFWLFIKFIEWLGGEDIHTTDQNHPYVDDSKHDDVSDTMWDIYTNHEVNDAIKHQYDNLDKNDTFDDKN